MNIAVANASREKNADDAWYALTISLIKRAKNLGRWSGERAKIQTSHIGGDDIFRLSVDRLS